MFYMYLVYKRIFYQYLDWKKKYFRVAFIDGQVLMWSRDKNINDAVVIGIHENGLYKLKGKTDQALVHSINPYEL